MATFFDLVIVFSNSQNDHWKKTTRAFALNVGVWIFLLTGILILNLLSNSASIFVWIFGNPYNNTEALLFFSGPWAYHHCYRQPTTIGELWGKTQPNLKCWYWQNGHCFYPNGKTNRCVNFILYRTMTKLIT